MTAVIEVFLARLESVKHCVELVEELRRLGSGVPPAQASRTRFGRQAITVAGQVKQAREWETICLDGAVLYMASIFEIAVRDAIEVAVGRLAARCRIYGELPEKTRSENLRLVGQLLTRAHTARMAHVDPVQVITDLERCLARGRPIKLFLGGFSFHENNLNSCELAKILKRLELNDPWQRVGEQAAMNGYFGGGQAADVARFARAKLDEFMALRNQIAHRGPSYESAGPGLVREYAEFFSQLIVALSVVLEAHTAPLGVRARQVRTAGTAP